MKPFRCTCKSRIFFDNTQCLNCSRLVGFSAESLTMVAWNEGTEKKAGIRPCANYGRGHCNWVLGAKEKGDFCLACRLNVETPAPGSDDDELMRKVEMAKRRLVFSLLGLGLPVVPLNENEGGVGFTLQRGTPEAPVITGHADGLITLDLNEANPAKREEARAKLGEDYRTLLGHFRHEVGHYYWTVFFQTDAEMQEFREVFGDERADYAEALKVHYANPRSDYQETHVSAYATSHPWEDWAETWAHYLHILASWETAVTFGLRASKGGPQGLGGKFEESLDEWIELMIALNAMNRSMGHDDAYPFQLAAEVRKKLVYIDKTARAGSRTLPTPPPKEPAPPPNEPAPPQKQGTAPEA